MGEILSALEAVEGRSQLEIIRDLFTASADVIRIRARSSSTVSGMIGLDEGVEMVQQAREMLLAAACSAEQKRAVFHSRKPTRAMEYINGARLGQTEHGSYVLTIVSPVQPHLEPREVENLVPEVPFERRVTETLAEAVNAMRIAAAEAALSGSMDAFTMAINKGVSANLCDAIVRLSKVSPNEGLEIGFSWSRNRPIPPKAALRVMLDNDTVPVIEAAAKHFRETEPREDFLLEGVVVACVRNQPDSVGKVRILGFVDNNPKKVSVILPDHDYAAAVQAHKKYLTVQCAGELVKAGRGFELRDVRHFRVLKDEMDEQ